MKKSMILFSLTLLFFTGCASFPVNDTDSDGLFMVPIVFDKSVPGEVFGSVQITITDMDGNFVADKKLSAHKDYDYLRLEPGKYKLKEKAFIYDSNKKGSHSSVNVWFEVKPGVITVYRYYLLYSFYTKPSIANTTYIRYDFLKTTPEIQSGLIAELEKEESFGSWDIEFQ